MVQIFKYPLETFTQEIELPLGAVFLHAECQHNNPVMWFRVDTENETEKRTFTMIGTGHKFEPMGQRFLTTFTQGPFVWHLHETYQIGQKVK